ncbi:MAG: Gfo/Idh/MocA family oxidoreductase [Ignavibacteriae bacterium]|nr:Gfo/Idh/MocA family oxidoreductase [Ignavibacteriota bacterium]
MKNSRREFLKGAGAAVTGVMLGGAGSTASSYARIIGANDRLMVGVVGFSDRAKDALLPAFWKHADELGFEIVGVSDIWNRRRAEGLAFVKERTGKAVRAYRNNDELYADRDVDAVIISTADFQHARHAVEAAQNRKHAYVEKPFAETMSDNRLALEEVRKSGIVLQIGSQRRSGPNYQKAAEYIASGKFGPITMVEMSWNINQPGRWRRPGLVADIQESDTDWKRYLIGRPHESWDPRKYVEYRLFWPYSSGIPGQWMCHQIDTVHWFSGYKFPRTVTANGGIYMWDDGRKNFDTMTAVFDFGPVEEPHKKGFQVVYSSRMHNSAGGIKEIYYSNGGELNLDTNRVTSNGGLQEREASAMGLKPNLLPETELTDASVRAQTAAATGVDLMTSLHMRNWLECMRSGQTPNAPVEAGYYHSVSTIMTTAALHTGKAVTFDAKAQEVLAGGEVFEF